MWYKVFSGAMDSETQEGKPMTDTAKTITTFRERAEQLWAQSNYPLSDEYRRKDSITDESYANRYHRAAEWLEERASAPTLAAIYPDIVIR